jgi:iron(III) transport system ATP-binding protein
MLTVEGLTRTFVTGDDQVQAVHDVSFEVKTGEFFSLLGPSGCGKTTTLRCIAGLETPDSGEIWIDDKPVFSSKSASSCRFTNATSAWFFSHMRCGRI